MKKQTFPLRFFLLLLLSTAFFPDIFSQNYKLPDSVQLRTVVIQATRANAKNPVPHTNISDEQLRRSYHAQDVPFLLTGISSLVESSDAGAGIGYTGMRIRGSDPTRINVTLNGVPLNDAESQNVFWVDLPDLASSASEIQVQRGVGVSTNGAGAFGATINLDLSRIDPEPFARVSNTLGSFNTRKHSLYLGSGLLRGHWSFSGRVSNIRSDGYIDRASARLNAVHLSGAYIDNRQSLQAHLMSGHEITYQAWNGVPAQYLDSLPTFNTAGTEKPGEPYPDEVDDYTQRHFLLHYKRALLPAYGLSLQLNGHYTRGFGFYEQYKAGQIASDYGLPDSTGTASDLVRRRWLDNHFYGATWVLRWAPVVNPPFFSGAPVLTLGGALSRYEGRHFGEVIWADRLPQAPKDWVYYDNDAVKTDANAYFRTEFNFKGGISTLLDLQYRGVTYAFLGYNNLLERVDQSVQLHFFNPKAGLNWAPRPGLALYAFAGIAQREPNRDDYTQSTPDSRPRPEKLFNVESGLRWEQAGWKSSVNLFWMRYYDQLALDGRLNDVGAYIRTNIPDSYRAGLEFETAGPLFGPLSAAGNIAFSRNKVQRFTEYRDNWDLGTQEIIEHRNTDLAFSPNIILRTEMSCQLLPAEQRHALSVTLSEKIVGKQYLDNTSNDNTALPAFYFTDLRLNYDIRNFIGSQTSFVLSINNLLDDRYVSNGWTYRFISNGYDARPDDPYARSEGNGIYNLTGFFPQAGRNWMMTMNVVF